MSTLHPEADAMIRAGFDPHADLRDLILRLVPRELTDVTCPASYVGQVRAIQLAEHIKKADPQIGEAMTEAALTTERWNSDLCQIQLTLSRLAWNKRARMSPGVRRTWRRLSRLRSSSAR